jgi:hypothetical protein
MRFPDVWQAGTESGVDLPWSGKFRKLLLWWRGLSRATGTARHCENSVDTPASILSPPSIPAKAVGIIYHFICASLH